MKKIVVLVGGFFVILVSAAVVAPLLFDVDSKIRPKIVETLNDSLNAKVELGKLNLSFWGGIYIGIESLQLLDVQDSTPVFEMKDARLQIPFLSLLGGKLRITLIADAPSLFVVKNRDGSLNLTRLTKTKGGARPESDQNKGSDNASVSGADRIEVSTNITNAKMIYKDQLTGQVSKIENLNLEMFNVALNKPFEVRVSADLDVQHAVTKLVGVVRVDGQLDVRMREKFESLTLKSKIDLGSLSIVHGSVFNKRPQVPLNLTTDIVLQPESLDLKELAFVVNTLTVTTSGKVEKFSDPEFDLKVTSNKLNLSDWKGILQTLNAFDMAGSASLNLRLKGTSENPQYSGKILVENVSMKVPGLVPRATGVNSTITLETNSVRIDDTRVVIGASDLALVGTIKNFSAPNVDFSMTSKNMNLDEMLGESKQKPQVVEKAKSEAQVDAEAEALAKGPIAEIKANPTLKNMNLKTRVRIDKLMLSKAPMTDVAAQLEFEKLVLRLRDARLKTFGGTVESQLSVDFNAAEPSYKVGAKVKDVEINEAVVSQFPDLKDFISGRTLADLDVSGAGVAPSKVKANLRGAGKFEIRGGKWSGLSPLKSVGEKLKSIPGAQEKLSGVVVGNRFKQLSAQFLIKESKLHVNSGVIDLDETRTTVTAQGYVAFDKTMKMGGHIIAPISNPPKALSHSDGRGKIPYEVEGLMMNPTPKWDVTLKPVAQAYLEDEGKKALKQGVDKLKESIPEGAVKDLLKNIKF